MDEEEQVNCEYCEVAVETNVYGNETYKYMGSLQDTRNYGMWIYKTNGKWILRSHGHNSLNEVFISHCPKCGRELT